MAEPGRATIDHVGLRVSELDAALAGYEAVAVALGHAPFTGDDAFRWIEELTLSPVDDAHPATTGAHVGLGAASREAVDAAWEAGRAAGLQDDGPPGERDYVPGYYGAFLRDADGNSLEAVHHEAVRPPRAGVVDHVWVRVADLARTRVPWAAAAAAVGAALDDRPGRLRLWRGPGSGSVHAVRGTPTRGLHFALTAADRATVDRFHAATTAAGATDDGAPGLRPVYHPGYYGAFVRDPDGTSLEAVHHAPRA
ncbi:hypothetical protein SK069_17670 [Patulibacter brassicae]|uniref:VOC domain-containing protein n=1 Tax=Patulibacter brassicae TaxID=1705717 RepID=A0ABU4VNK6_9ACTN|nr:VOC family protein [Patulibacter brassicae]MDX8153431.1 hypothetical protein [Patulibacter brassicae]